MKHISEFLAEGMREVFEERAAIMHFEGGLPKEKAEALAKAESETWLAKQANLSAMNGMIS